MIVRLGWGNRREREVVASPRTLPSLPLYLVLDGEVDEVGVDQDLVGWAELGVPLEEEGGGRFLTLKGGRRGEGAVVSGCGGSRSPFFLSLFVRVSPRPRPINNLHMADLLIIALLLALAGGGGLFCGGPNRRGERGEHMWSVGPSRRRLV